jgi:hypothetical protein
MGQYLLGAQSTLLLLVGTSVPASRSASHAVKVSLINSQKRSVGNSYEPDAASTLEQHRFRQGFNGHEQGFPGCPGTRGSR